MVEVYVVSAFSKGNQGGNKAGVVLDCRSLTPADMAAIAKDLGYSETAFLISASGGQLNNERAGFVRRTPCSSCKVQDIISFRELPPIVYLRS